MSSNKSIEFLENLQFGMPCCVNIKLRNGKVHPKTCFYAGYEDDLYKFFDGEGISGVFGCSKKYIEEDNVVVNDDYDEDRFCELMYILEQKKEKKVEQEELE